ncbi:histidine phosphatase family protein [Tropheryma whipplei]|uniref:histidine phosphatase family protein n=1 Tax=Tropheryma whipplei TaxID=2039 RepID=UPI0004B0ADD1|nr:histidine phosphatase family protein [Tropheryma whipplei]MCO8190277.1 histidine phosphatase family protein [Tropheryma whipplei]
MIHLVRHAQVNNPTGILYGRLPNYRITESGECDARRVADFFSSRKVSALYASPLLRTQLSAKPISEALNLEIKTDNRLIEPYSYFEGKIVSGSNSALRSPRYWHLLRNPVRPSWGEPYESILSRMLSIISGAKDSEHDVVMVTHQLPIWIVHLHQLAKPLFHNPKTRRCTVSSITSFEYRDDSLVEAGYVECGLKCATNK